MNSVKKKILISTGLYPPEIGGPATYSKLMNDRLPDYGFDVFVLPFSTVRKYPKIIRHVVFFLKALGLTRKVDVVFAQDTVSVGLPTMLACKILNKKFLVRVPGDYAWEQSTQRFGVTDSIDDFQNNKHGLRPELLKMIQRFVVNNATYVVTPSVYFKNLVSKWCKDPQKVNAIYNGIDFLKLNVSREDTRVSLKFEKDDFIILSSGRLVPWKGFDLLIKLVRKYMDEDKNIYLYIVGDGPDSDKLHAMVKNLGLEKRVLFLGSIPRDLLYKYLFASNVFALNTGFESFSFQIVEAMYCKTPVVATMIGNLPEIIDNGIEGQLVKYNSLEEFEKALHRVMVDNDFVIKSTELAKNKALNFSIDNTITNLIKLL